MNETSRCTAGRVSKNARARRCRAQAQKKCLRLVFLQHLWSSPGSQGPRSGAMQPTTTGWSVSGPVGRVGSNSAVFAALSDIKTSGESSDEAPHHRANWVSNFYLKRAKQWQFAYFLLEAGFRRHPQKSSLNISHGFSKRPPCSGIKNPWTLCSKRSAVGGETDRPDVWSGVIEARPRP